MLFRSGKHTFLMPSGNSVLVPKNGGESQEEYLIYCPNILKRHIYRWDKYTLKTLYHGYRGAIALKTKPSDGVYDKVVYTDFPLKERDFTGNISSVTLTIKELNPLSYLSEEVVGTTPTTKVSPSFTMPNFNH